MSFVRNAYISKPCCHFGLELPYPEFWRAEVSKNRKNRLFRCYVEIFCKKCGLTMSMKLGPVEHPRVYFRYAESEQNLNSGVRDIRGQSTSFQRFWAFSASDSSENQDEIFDFFLSIGRLFKALRELVRGSQVRFDLQGENWIRICKKSKLDLIFFVDFRPTFPYGEPKPLQISSNRRQSQY